MHFSEENNIAAELPPDYPRASKEERADIERVKCATLRLDGKLYWGVSHGDITINKLTDAELESIEHMTNEEIDAARGFITTHDRPVSVAEGYVIAEHADQLDEEADYEHPNAEHVHCLLKKAA